MQQQQIQLQQQQIDELINMVNKLSPDQLKNVIKVSLGQNTPNPVRRSTSISYGIPSGSKDAKLLLTDNLGIIIKTIQLDPSGVVRVDASSFSSGVYSYSLVVDGKIIETRKMVVVKDE